MSQILQEKLDQLDQEREQMYGAVAHLSDDELHEQSYGWSIIQVFSHLNDAEVGSILYMKKKMQAGDKMPNFSMGNRFRMSLAKLFLQSSIKWKAPSYIGDPEGKFTLEEMKEKWGLTREKTRAYVKEYPDELLGKAVFKHPFAGRLDLSSGIDSLIYHQRHHMHQLKRIKKMVEK